MLLARLFGTPGEPDVSSWLPSTPSRPGCGARRLSPPPNSVLWHVPQDTRLLLDICSSQNRILPSTVLAGVTGLPAGTGGDCNGFCAARAEPRAAATANGSRRERVATLDMGFGPWLIPDRRHRNAPPQGHPPRSCTICTFWDPGVGRLRTSAWSAAQAEGNQQSVAASGAERTTNPIAPRGNPVAPRPAGASATRSVRRAFRPTDSRRPRCAESARRSGRHAARRGPTVARS